MELPFLGVYRDIKNYIFLKNVIKRESMNSPTWSKMKLRTDWLNRIYTVVNLPPEVVLSPDVPEEIRPAYVLEETRPINKYLTDLNLHEIITPEFKPLKGTDSYLVIYNPYFRDLTWFWIITRVSAISFCIYLQTKFHIFTWIFDFIRSLL